MQRIIAALSLPNSSVFLAISIKPQDIIIRILSGSNSMMCAMENRLTRTATSSTD